jgi:putative endopeptidase
MKTLPWMSPATRSYAIVKLQAMRKKIGYPDKPISYANLVPQTDSYLANRYRAGQFAWNYDMAKIGKPNNRDLWGQTAQTVNAGYEPTNNDITFPAAILQPPFFDLSNDDALNYGAIGAIMGHEMTHGFDDQGRLYDAKGNQRNWWTPADATRFNARAKCISDFYDTLPVDATQKQKGALVLGEAIADLGGATIAFKTLERIDAGKSKTKIQGFTPEQRFFLAYATLWSTNFRPAAAKLQANSDVHALDFNRVRGTLMNMPQFAKAWYCPLNAKMVRPPAQRCQIW